ncbi:hypothetical protein BRADI_4g05860v3 [Brachypodium distachyon]|uniref:Carrier domain-containing protein n=1 Tax=Brachypodium distachyon TaxID=15368 RepID=A0A0Q3IJU7_BRADI|nr:hypothetical protein BRADI_4g05860v3 [Brachypodium distachyon]
MAHSLAAVSSFSPSAVRRRLSSQVINVISCQSLVSFSSQRMSFVSIRSVPSPLRFKICCSAKQETQAKKETVDKVCAIVKKQLAVPDGTAVTADSKFSELGADSLDTVVSKQHHSWSKLDHVFMEASWSNNADCLLQVEIVMGLEEEFNITVDETSAQDIATVQDAANLIEKLVAEKTA